MIRIQVKLNRQPALSFHVPTRFCGHAQCVSIITESDILALSLVHQQCVQSIQVNKSEESICYRKTLDLTWPSQRASEFLDRLQVPLVDNKLRINLSRLLTLPSGINIDPIFELRPLALRSAPLPTVSYGRSCSHLWLFPALRRTISQQQRISLFCQRHSLTPLRAQSWT